METQLGSDLFQQQQQDTRESILSSVVGVTLSHALVCTVHRGTRLHELCEAYLRSGVRPEPPQEQTLGALWGSVQHVLSRVSDVRALELPTVHAQMKYAGTLDCLAR